METALRKELDNRRPKIDEAAILEVVREWEEEQRAEQRQHNSNNGRTGRCEMK